MITCSSYANRHTVYSAATFCPVCGLRPTTDIVLELIQPHGTSQVPNSPLKDSQRLVIRRADAEAALGDLAALAGQGPAATRSISTSFATPARRRC